MDKFWYTNELKQLYSELLDIREKDGSNDIIDITIKVMEDTFKEDIEDSLRFNPSLKKNLAFPRHFLTKEYKILSPTSFWWPSIDKIANQKFAFKPQDEPKLDLTNQDLMDLTHDFYQNGTNKKIYEIFLKLYKNTEFDFIDNEEDINIFGDSIYLPYYEKFLMRVNRSYTFYDAATMAHEFGHGIEMANNYYKSIYCDIYVEVVSLFMEMLFYNYFSKSKEFQNTAIDTFQKFYYSSIMDAKRIQLELNILREIKSSNLHILKKNASKYIKNNTGIVNDVIYDTPTSNYTYTIGLSIALELFMVYVKDPDKAFYLLFKIMNIKENTPSKEFFNRLITLGINPCENLSNFDTYLKRRLSK